MTHEDAIKWLGNLRNDLGNPHYECLWPYAQALDEIAQMLEEQEPKPAVVTTNAYGTKFYHCPKCNHDLYTYPRQRYCSQCGQAVKWE